MLTPEMRLLLISTSTVHGTGYLDHAESEIRDHLREIDSILFVPYALADHDGYTAKAQERFAAMGLALNGIHREKSPAEAVTRARAVFIGGGNTFRLLKALHELGLIDAIRKRALAGMPYMGASAGSNVACPTIRTTNDMPIVEPPSLQALDLFPYQINPHYLDPVPGSTHMGETREQRLLQYLEENTRPVIGLREGSMLRVHKGEIRLLGKPSARIFESGKDPYEVASPAVIQL